MGERRPTAAGLVIVRFRPDPEFLLLRSYDYWDFPKGMIEAGESPIEAARRETLEETGISDVQFAWGEAHVDTLPYGKQHKIVRYFLAQTSADIHRLPVSPELGHPEHHEFRWVSYSDAWELLVPRLRAVLDWAELQISLSKMAG